MQFQKTKTKFLNTDTYLYYFLNANMCYVFIFKNKMVIFSFFGKEGGGKSTSIVPQSYVIFVLSLFNM